MSRCHDVTMSPNLMSPNLMSSCCDVEMLRCHVVVGYHEIMVWECVISGCILCGVFLWCIFGIPVFSLACYFCILWDTMILHLSTHWIPSIVSTCFLCCYLCMHVCFYVFILLHTMEIPCSKYLPWNGVFWSLVVTSCHLEMIIMMMMIMIMMMMMIIITISVDTMVSTKMV